MCIIHQDQYSDVHCSKLLRLQQDTDQFYIGAWTDDHKTHAHRKSLQVCREKVVSLYMNCHITTVFTRTPEASLTGKIDSSNAESKTHFISRGLTVSSMLNGKSCTHLVGQVVPANQCFLSLLVFLGFHLGHLVLVHHLVLVLHPSHPFLGAPEQCIYWVW